MFGTVRDERNFPLNYLYGFDLTHSLGGPPGVTPNFARSGGAALLDHEGIYRLASSGEPRFFGARRIQNETQNTNSNNVNISWSSPGSPTVTPDSMVAPDWTLSGDLVDCGGVCAAFITNSLTTGGSPGLTGDTWAYNFWIKPTPGVAKDFTVYCGLTTSTGGRLVSLRQTADGALSVLNHNGSYVQLELDTLGWYRFRTYQTLTLGGAVGCVFGNLDVNQKFGLWGGMVTRMNGDSVPLIHEYISKGVLSAPYYGAGLDGVAYSNVMPTAYANYILDSENQSLAGWSKGGNVSCPSQDQVVFGGVGDFITNRLSRGWPPLYGTRGGRGFRIGVVLPPAEKWSDPTVSITVYDTYTGTNAVATPLPGAYRKVSVTGSWGTPASSSATLVIFSNKASTCSERLRAYAHDFAVGSSARLMDEYVATDSNTPTLYTTGKVISVNDVTNWGFAGEGQRANLLIRSEEFSDVAWSKTDITVTANDAIGPDGRKTADLLTEGTLNTAIASQNSAAYTANSVVCYGVALKRNANANWFRVTMTGVVTPADSVRAWFDLANGVTGAASASGLGSSVLSGMFPLGHGWYFCWVSFLPNATETQVACHVCSAAANGDTNRVNNATYWATMAQCEVGKEPSSYIPTTTASVTRNPDILQYVSPADTPYASGGFYAEITPLTNISPVSAAVITLRGATNGRPGMLGSSRGFQMNDASGVYPLASGALANRTTYRVASTWGAGTMSIAKGPPVTNQLGQTFDGDMGASGAIDICHTNSSSQFFGCIKRVRLYGFKPTDQQMNNLVAA